MPATGDPPALADFLKAYGEGVRGYGSGSEDTRRGSGYDVPGGVSALAWARQAQRDRALFRNCYTDTATGDDLERHVLQKYGVARVQETFGAGSAFIARPTAAGGAGTVWEGTRIEVLVGGVVTPYAVASDTAITATQLMASVPVRPTRAGSGTAASASAPNVRWGDSVFDATFAVASLTCSDGTDLEPAEQYVARARAARRDARVGYTTRIVQACRDAGAVNVVALDAGSLGAAFDDGISRVYVGDAGYTTSDALKKACVIALDDVDVAGCDVQVLGMTQALLTLSAAVTLWDTLDSANLIDLKQVLVAFLVNEFQTRTNWWTFRADALQGGAQQIDPAIQSVAITTNPAPPAVGFPAVLTRYVLAPSAITMTFQAAS